MNFEDFSNCIYTDLILKTKIFKTVGEVYPRIIIFEKEKALEELSLAGIKIYKML